MADAAEARGERSGGPAPRELEGCTTAAAAAAAVLATADVRRKAELTRWVAAAWRSRDVLVEPYADGDPCAPERPAHGGEGAPEAVRPGLAPRRGKGGTPESRVAMLHALVHTEGWAIDLAWDAVARFARAERMPEEFVSDFVAVAEDEARHFLALEARLEELGSRYGALPAHDGLWDSAAETAGSLRARLAVEHAVHEARGLDVLPTTIERFARNGDEPTAALLRDVVYPEEVAHCAAGVRWFRWLEARDAVEDEAAVASSFQAHVRAHFRGPLKPPFNDEARARAGFSRSWYEPLAEEAAAA